MRGLHAFENSSGSGEGPAPLSFSVRLCYSCLRAVKLVAIDHVQLAMPSGREDAARTFYRDALGLPEIDKPVELAARGGVWFGSALVQLHLGVEVDFRPAKKAHPAIRVELLDQLADRLSKAGHEIQFDDDLPGYRRFYVCDPFGNRLEFLEPASAGLPA